MFAQVEGGAEHIGWLKDIRDSYAAHKFGTLRQCVAGVVVDAAGAAVAAGYLAQRGYRFGKEQEDQMLDYMSAGKLAVRLTATFAPLDDGRRTRVTAMVERGDAPDDFVSPAFRSKGLAMALFSGVLESELNELTAPPSNPAACAELHARWRWALGSTDQMHQDNLTDAVGDTITTVMKLSAYDAEMRRNGCSPAGGNDFKPIENRMDMTQSRQVPHEGVNFQPGEPMVDVSAGASR